MLQSSKRFFSFYILSKQGKFLLHCEALSRGTVDILLGSRTWVVRYLVKQHYNNNNKYNTS